MGVSDEKENQDHPHACGDKQSNHRYVCLCEGSSPRVWGQGVAFAVRDDDVGIIPTRVGTSNRPLHYPNTHLGSSPRVWGQGIRYKRVQPRRRIIPTRVGTRLKKSRKIAVLQNQPLRFPLTFHRSFV